MELVPVYGDGSVGGTGGGASGPPGTVKITVEKQQVIGVATAEVKRTPTSDLLRVPGRIVVDDARLYRLIAASDGWIRDLGPNPVGTSVKKDQVLASYYAQNFQAAQQTLLFNVGTVDQLPRGSSSTGLQRPPVPLNLQIAIDTLRGLGMSDLQIDEIRRTRTFASAIHIYSPVAGFVLARNISPDQRFDKGAELYRIADISRVWVMADIFEKDREFARPGTMATVRYQGHAFPARMSQVLPQIDPQSRTLKVRFEVDNRASVLRPDMFVDVEVPVTRTPAIVVPANAVVDTGMTQIVYVAKDGGVFEPRKVETGWRAGDQVEIVKGLMPGETIVVSGTFLIDSESRMKAAAAGIYGESSEDPVCGMEVDHAKAKAAGHTAAYRGETYYFCSDECKVSFDKAPAKYAAKVSPGAMTPAGQRLSGVEWEGGKAKEKESAHVGHMHSPTASAGK
jgi:multidrug efflux pump subunit AcrA (membrane-fusion protein)/YHS domain-containing protein